MESAAGRILEYEPVEDVHWRIDRADLLREDFGVSAADVDEWHRAMAGRGRAWEILSRLYQVGELLDPDEEVTRSWTRAELGKRFGIPKAEVDHEIEHAVEFWNLRKARGQVAEVVAAEGGEIDQLASFANAAGMGSRDVDRLLEMFGFSEIRGELFRAQTANRLLSLKDYLMSQHTRTMARQLVRWEVSLHTKERMLLVYTSKIEELLESDRDLQSKGGEIDKLREKAADLDREIRVITTAHSKMQKDLGADDIDMTTRKRIFVETVAYVQEACRMYESDPENLKVDGVFRADEIDWLLEPEGERAPQYRPDISVRLHEALQPRNLWDPKYKPTPISRRVCQELQRLAECMRAVPEDAPPLPDLDADEEDGLVAGDGMVPVSADVLESPAPAVFGARGDDGPAMGVF